MSVGPMGGILGSAAGAPQAQSRGSEADRAGQDQGAHERRVDVERSADKASGIGQTDEDQETSERDADGRRLWEVDAEAEPGKSETADAEVRASKDPSGQSGRSLDLSI